MSLFDELIKMKMEEESNIAVMSVTGKIVVIPKDATLKDLVQAQMSVAPKIGEE